MLTVLHAVAVIVFAFTQHPVIDLHRLATVAAPSWGYWIGAATIVSAVLSMLCPAITRLGLTLVGTRSSHHPRTRR